MSASAVVQLACELINRPSITPDDCGCQVLLGERLAKLGFSLEPLNFVDTNNLWARRGNSGPVFAFAGHTDVVPAGDLSAWHTPAFTATVQDGNLIGRGAADMKGALAAMIIATERFVSRYPDHRGSIAFLLTSDEEGPFINGTTRVVDTLMARNELIDWCIVGEPSSSAHVGDTIKNGRRGSLSAALTVFGVQGHVAYPDKAKNPIHAALPALAKLSSMQWDHGNAFFPPTSMQLTDVHAGIGASNVIPGQLRANFNFRFSSEVTHAQLKAQVATILDQYQLDYQLEWSLSGEPFLTPSGTLVDAVSDAILHCTGQTTQLSTSGGTSDGRFISKMGGQVIELGVVNSSIHQANEWVKIDDLEKLVDIYEESLKRLLIE
ncbi:MAG: succinyl-diaminopimelate desuccinylase [Vibrionaceae bacterium]